MWCYGFWGFGISVFLMTQVISNLKILIFSSSFYILNVLIIVFSVLASTIAGLIPAWRAAKLQPVEALRSE